MIDPTLTLARFLAEAQRPGAAVTPALAAVLLDVAGAVRAIARTVSRGALAARPRAGGVNVHGERQDPLDLAANEVLLGRCERSGRLAGIASEELEAPYRIPARRFRGLGSPLPAGRAVGGPTPPSHARGELLLVLDPLDGSSNVEVNVTVGTIFSVLRRPGGPGAAEAADFLQPGTAQLCAGYALYGPCTMLVLTVGDGVHGFTLDRERGEFVLTHPRLRIPDGAREFAINASNERFWEPPVRRYVGECRDGAAGARGEDFNMRWIASLVAEVHRILVRGGVFLYPRDSREPLRPGRLRLLYEASPMALLVEQAGGAASTGRERLLDLEPSSLHQRVPVILGARAEVERLVRYHDEHARGAAAPDRPFRSPLFATRSLFTEP